MPFPFGDEMKGIAKISGIPLGNCYCVACQFIIVFLTGEIVLYNIFFEVSGLCTSIIGQTENGKLFHARNLDFGLLMG